MAASGSMDQSAAFSSAQSRVKELKQTPPPAQLLELYALFKQGTMGDAKGARPGLLDMKGRAKFDAWSKKRGMAPETAQEAYVALVEQLLVAQG